MAIARAPVDRDDDDVDTAVMGRCDAATRGCSPATSTLLNRCSASEGGRWRRGGSLPARLRAAPAPWQGASRRRAG